MVDLVILLDNNVKIDFIGLEYTVHLPSCEKLSINQSEYTHIFTDSPEAKNNGVLPEAQLEQKCDESNRSIKLELESI